jgi:hypothetical protein
VRGLASRLRFRSDTGVLFSLGGVRLLIHLLVNGRYGIFRDELYYIVCGQRLAFGYVDHPPLTPLMARLSRSLFGDSLLGLRLLPALAGAATVVLAGLIARKLGGGRRAQVLAAVGVLVSPILLNFGNLLTTNALDVFFWTLAAYLLTVILKEGRPKLWPAFGLVVGLGLQNKYSIGFFVAALGIGLVLSPARKELRSVWLWAGAAIAAAVILPNLIWQVRHGLPFVELNRNAVAAKNAVLSPPQFLLLQFVEILPFVFLVAAIGLVYFLFGREAKPVRAFGWAYLALFAFFAFSGGKPYYLASVYPVMLAGGAVALERWSARPGRRWLVPSLVVLTVLGGAALAPLVVPVLPVDRLVAYSQRLGIQAATDERHEMGPLPQHFADQFGWEEMTKEVAGVYQGLGEAERSVCAIFAQNYGEASAIDVLGRKYGLPRAASGHNSYWLWGLPPGRGEVAIVIGGKAEDLRQSYREVVEVARHSSQYGMPYENRPIFLCRGLTVKLQDVWPGVKEFI